ncbi:MAG: hypothetical protein GQ527_10110, partial [Bacteroidales bacterium]|nr:hypothetical protein [Bacteroidales bacterium]
DTTIINRYPVNPISSRSSFDCHVGIVALWFIETIRLTEQDNSTSRLKYPSITPSLMYLGNDPNEYPTNSKELMELAYQEYEKWWKKVEHINRGEASQLDPLKGTKIFW